MGVWLTVLLEYAKEGDRRDGERIVLRDLCIHICFARAGVCQHISVTYEYG
jgi:hypothetical protein